MAVLVARVEDGLLSQPQFFIVFDRFLMVFDGFLMFSEPRVPRHCPFCRQTGDVPRRPEIFELDPLTAYAF